MANGYCAEDIVDRLKRRFPLGDKPDLALALYERVAAIVEEEGDRAYHILCTAADDAIRARTTPARYFRWLVMRRFRDRGLLPALEL